MIMSGLGIEVKLRPIFSDETASIQDLGHKRIDWALISNRGG
jgi:hypothetical protein